MVQVEQRYLGRIPAARYLGISPRMLGRLVAARQIVCIKPDCNRVLFDVQVLDSFMQSRSTNAKG